MTTALLALNQLQAMKEKIDPEVFDLLNKSGHEAISSAHHFLDACEKALDGIVSSDSKSSEIDLEESEDLENVVNLNKREA